MVPTSATMATYNAYEHFGWIARVAPAFRVDGDKVEVLQDPTQFYERLKVCTVHYVWFLSVTHNEPFYLPGSPNSIIVITVIRLFWPDKYPPFVSKFWNQIGGSALRIF